MRFNADDICLQVIDNRPHLCFRVPAEETHQVVAKTAQLKDFIAKNKEVRIDVNKMTEKRSLNANAYMWTLCSMLAEKLSNDKVKYVKEDIYRKEIKEAGIWAADGNKEVIRFYYGSSRYNKNQMQRLLNNLVQDCQAVGIETKTPDEIANLVSLWEQAR